MSKNRWTMLGQGLLLASCTGLAWGVADDGDGPSSRRRAAVTATAPAVAAERYVLLTDGRLIRGVVTRDEDTYSVTLKGGTIRKPKRQVERTFDSLEEAFRYQLDRIPDDDPSERLKLARWCLTWHLDDQARVLLEQVLEISPDHGPARAMLNKIHQSEATRVQMAQTKVDEDVQQTVAEGVADDRPGALDSAVLRGAERRMGISGLPVVFDLPPAAAVQKTEQFRRYVVPVLQSYCVECHNADYNGRFQLVPMKAARQRTPDAIRANLDATLRLIDPENPERSELLSSTLRPHGVGPKKRPIFLGSNDRAYQILAAWTTSLRSAPSDRPSTAMRPDAGDAEAFATDRSRSAGEPIDEIARGGRIPPPRRLPAMAVPAGAGGGDGRSYRYLPGQGMVEEDPKQADPREFPLPYVTGGQRPSMAAAAPAAGPGRIPTPAAPRQPKAGASAPGKPAPETAADPDVPAPKKKASVKIDPKSLETFLKRSAKSTDAP